MANADTFSVPLFGYCRNKSDQTQLFQHTELRQTGGVLSADGLLLTDSSRVEIPPFAVMKVSAKMLPYMLMQDWAEQLDEKQWAYCLEERWPSKLVKSLENARANLREERERFSDLKADYTLALQRIRALENIIAGYAASQGAMKAILEELNTLSGISEDIDQAASSAPGMPELPLEIRAQVENADVQAVVEEQVKASLARRVK